MSFRFNEDVAEVQSVDAKASAMLTLYNRLHFVILSLGVDPILMPLGNQSGSLA